MRPSFVLVLVALLTSCATTGAPTDQTQPAFGYGAPNSLHILLGGRALDEDDWEPVENQFTFGVEGAHEQQDSIVGFEGGMQVGYSSDEAFLPGTGNVDVQSTSFEFYGGLRKSFLRQSLVHPYLGTGLSVVVATFEVDDGSSMVDDDDTSFGWYAHGGALFAISDSFGVGLDLRILRGTDLSLFDVSTDADYEQVAVFLALSF